MDHIHSSQSSNDLHRVTLPLEAVLEGFVQCVVCQDSLTLPPHHLFRDHQFSLQCNCGMIHEIIIGSRSYSRKVTCLEGHYHNLVNATQMGHIIIEDLSFGGIGFYATEPHMIQIGDRLRIEFSLDDEACSWIEVAVRVHGVWDDVIGVEFNESDGFNHALAAYLIR